MNEEVPAWLKQVRAKRAAEQQAAQPVQHDADLIPDQVYDRSEEDNDLDRFLDRLSCIDAYNKFCGKSHPVPRPGQTEGIKVSCPNPNHPDKNPSAWINTKEGPGGVWFCGGCQEGGDKFDIAAFHFGYPVPGYKDGVNFHNLRREMAEAYGWTFTKTPTSDFPIAIPPEPKNSAPLTNPDKPDISPDLSDKSDTPKASGHESTDAQIVSLFPELDEETRFPAIDWRAIVTPESFLDSYMQQVSQDDAPEEYHFWNGLLAIGLAMGRDARMQDTPVVYGNLFVCTLGKSGSGKSKAKYHLDKLISSALPHDWNDSFSKGVVRINAPGSAESLIDAFCKPLPDPVDPKKIVAYMPVRGIVDYNELSSLLGRANRVGNVTKPTLMEIYDMQDEISTRSLSTGLKKASQPFGSVITTTQPKAIATLLTQNDADSGFLNRWVFSAGPYKKRQSFIRTEIDLTVPIKLLKEILGWASTLRAPLIWDEDAQQYFEKFFDTTIEHDQRTDDTGMLVRLDLLMKKLALLFTANDKKISIDIASVEKAIAVYPYLKETYGILAAKIGDTLEQEIHEALLTQIKRLEPKFPAGVPQGTLKDALKGRKYPFKVFDSVLKHMVNWGELSENSSITRGKPTVRYQLTRSS